MSRIIVGLRISLVLSAVGALGVAGSGCAGDTGIPLVVTPNHASLFGQTEVTISGDLPSLGTVNYFSVAGLQVVNARWSGSSVTVTVQGAPRPGRYDIVIQGTRGRTIQHNVFTYDPPPAGVPLTWMAFGASFTQGTESSGIDPHSQVYGVSGQIGRTAGVFLGLPLFSPQVAPPLQPADFYPDCRQKPGTGAGANTLTTVLTSPDTGLFDLRYGRLDWTLKNRNVAVGGATIFDILDGVHGAKSLLAHLVNDPSIDSSDSVAPETTSMIDRVEALDPDVGFTTDLLGNDLDQAVTQPEDLDPGAITPVATIAPMLQTMMARLGKLRGQYFIANIPSLTFVPHVTELRRRLVAAGKDTSAFDAKAAQIDALTDEYNQTLIAAMAPYPNLHIVDFKKYVADVKDGVRVGGEWLTPQHFGGLLSLDDLHLSDTGYALYAQTFIDRFNEVLHTNIGAVDVATAHAQDALAPSRLRGSYSCVPAAQ